MYEVLLIALSAWTLFAIGRPIIRYIQDAKGFRKYPVQNSFSGISALAYCWEVGRSHRKFHTRRLHEKLVKHPVVRIGPNWLSFGRASAARDIYGFTSPCLKGAIYDALQGDGLQLNIITQKAVHSARRKMVAAAYAPRNIETWEPRVTDSTAVLVSKLDALCTAAPTSPIGLVPQEELTLEGNLWSLLYAFECGINIGLSKDVGFLAQGSDLVEVSLPGGTTEKAHAIDCLRSGARAASTIVWDPDNYPLLKKISGKISPWYASQWHKSSLWAAYAQQLIKERLERHDGGEHLQDLTQLMIEDRKGAQADISTSDREVEVTQLINGGGDGAGISLVNTLYYLAKYPETRARLRAELDEALAPEDTIAPWLKVKNLAYLRACVDESMRLSPPVATDLIRRTPADRSYTVDGEVIAPDTHVSISAYTAHRDPDIFPEPEAFKPERWLIKGDDKLKNMLAAYIPFSTGTRGCIGRNVAILIQLKYIATFVHRYDFALPSPDWEMEWMDYFNLWPKELPLKIWKRHRETAV